MEEFMDKIELLRARRQKLLESGKEIRSIISDFTDEKTFVELDAYSFSRNDFYGADAEGEGVVTGYATINGVPVYIVAQNVKVLSGGVSFANCKKIKKCLDKAAFAGAPVIYLLDSLGVSVGEGVNVLEGIGEILAASSDLKGRVPQFSVVLGKVYGSFSVLCANCDCNIMIKDAKIAYASPFVISAQTGISEDEIAGEKSAANSGIVSLTAENVSAARDEISKILGVLPEYSAYEDSGDDLNRVSENLNEKVCPKCLQKAVFDDGEFTEFNKDFCPEVAVGVGKIGGIGVGAIIFGGDSHGVELDAKNVAKIKKFADFTSENGLPLVTFVNALGIKTDAETSRSTVLTEVAELIASLRRNARLSVVYGKAVGLGYTLFASKSLGVDYSFAFANAKVALFDGPVSAVSFGEVREDKIEELEERYSDENADPVNASKNGFIDNIIEPQFVRPYVASALQMISER